MSVAAAGVGGDAVDVAQGKMTKLRVKPVEGNNFTSLHATTSNLTTASSRGPEKCWLRLVVWGVTLAVAQIIFGNLYMFEKEDCLDSRGTSNTLWRLPVDPSKSDVEQAPVRALEKGDSHTTPVKRYLFHEIPAEEFLPSKLKDEKIIYTTSFSEATVLAKSPHTKTRKICKETCCAETVSISLEQDDHRIINTMDGADLADVRYQKHHTRPHYEEFFALDMTEDILPCLQPGTIIQVHASRLSEFFETFRPKINVPYVLITSESDIDSLNIKSHAVRLRTDKLLLHWYGSNPLARNIPKDTQAKQKFKAIPLGLSKMHDQSRLLTRYLQFRNFTNPFSGDQKRRWTKATALLDLEWTDQNKIDTTFYDTVLVKFGINPKLPSVYKRRKPLFDTLCDKINTTAHRDTVTCSMAGFKVGQPGKLRTDVVYHAASQHLFGMSPEGAGWDCYRTYELLLLGVIPIVSARVGGTHDLYDDLPVIEVERMHQKNRSRAEYLQIMKDYIQSPKFLNANFEKGWERLFLRYWRRHTLKMANRDGEIWTDEYGREFYQAWQYSSTSEK